MRPTLHPSLTAALLAVSDEVAELRKRGEDVSHIEPSWRAPGVFMTTSGGKGPIAGVWIFGFSDEESR